MNRSIYILLLFFILFLFSCNPQESKKIPPKAVKGVLDLRELPLTSGLNHSLMEGGTIDLDGEWEFYWKESVPNYIPVPSQWQNHGYPVDGYATYRLRVLLPEFVPAKSVRVGDAYMHRLHEHGLSIAMTDAGTSYEMYINGKLASVNGKVGMSKEDSVPFRQYRHFPIDGFLYNFESEEGAKTLSRLPRIPDKNEIEILVHVSNFHHIMSGLWLPFKLGSTIEIEKHAKQKLILDLFVIASLLMMGLYHLGLYLNRKKDKTALYFGLFCILFAIRTSSLDESVILDIVPNLSFLIMHKFEYFAFYYGSYVFAQYIHSLFPTEFEKKWIRVLSFILFPLSAIVILFPLKIYAYTLLPAQITVLLSIVYIFKVQIFSAVQRLPGAKLILVSWAIFALTVVNDILNGMSLIVSPLLVQYGFVAFIFMQSIILSRRFAGGFEVAEKLSDDLQVLTQSLESKISDGVREKEKYSQRLLELSKSKTNELFGFEAALREITERCCEILNIDRVSIWKLEDVKNELKSIDLFTARENKHEQGVHFLFSNFPKYFQYLKEEDILSASDVYTHSGIMEFNEDYHTILKIQSALDSPIRSGGKIIGVISCEKIEIKKDWTVDEENFVSSLANILASLFESEERRQAYIELTETKKEIEELNTFSHLVNSLSDLNSIFTEISKYFYHKFGIIAIWLFLPDEKREYLSAFKIYSYNKLPADKYDYLMNRKVPMKENEGGMLYKTFQRKKPFFLGKIPKFEFGIDKEIVEKLSIVSFLQVPLVRKDECVGIFSFSNFEKEMKLSKMDIHKISNLCSQIASSVDTNHLLQQVEKAKEKAVIAKQETETLNEISKSVNSNLNIKGILDLAMGFVNQSFGIDLCALYLVENQKNIIVLNHISNTVKDHVTLTESELLNYEFSLEKIDHALGYVYQTKETLYTKELTESINEMEKKLIDFNKLKSALLIPLLLKRDVIGILGFGNYDRILDLKESEITTLETIADQLTGAIYNSNLLAEMEKAKSQADTARIEAEIERGISVIAKLEVEKAKQKTEDLNLLIKKVNETSDLEEIMKIILSYVKDNYNLPYYSLFTLDPKENVLKFANAVVPDYVTPEHKKMISSSVLSLASKNIDSIHSRALILKSPIFIPDAEAEVKTESGKAMQTVLKHKSFLTLPIILQNNPIGTLDLFSIESVRLREEEITELSLLAEQLAGVIQGATLFKLVQEEKEKALAAQLESEKSKAQIEFLNEFSKVINSFNNLDIIFSHAVENLSNKIETDIFQLQLVDKTKNELFTRCISGTDSDLLKKYNKLRVPLIPESGSLYLTYTSKKTLYLKNIKIIGENRKSELDKMVEKDFQTDFVFLIPLLVNDEVIGIMSIGKFGGMKKLKDDEIRFVESLCEQLALAVNNSFLLEAAESERNKSEKLLLNILPKDVAAELKEKGFAEPVLFENVSVMFTDFKGFTTIAETLTPQELIKDLDACFVQFDKISERFNLEKLKTIGDSYMCAGGIPRRNTTHAIDCCLAALEIQSFMNMMKKLKEDMGFPYWELRLGIHTGPLIAGVIGERKFAYDVWGDTVNTASRMESSGTPGRINISYSTYEVVKDLFDCEYRGEVSAKNKGVVKMYYLNRIKPEFSKDEEGLMPNGKFWEIYG